MGGGVVGIGKFQREKGTWMGNPVFTDTVVTQGAEEGSLRLGCRGGSLRGWRGLRLGRQSLEHILLML